MQQLPCQNENDLKGPSERASLKVSNLKDPHTLKNSLLSAQTNQEEIKESWSDVHDLSVTQDPDQLFDEFRKSSDHVISVEPTQSKCTFKKPSPHSSIKKPGEAEESGKQSENQPQHKEFSRQKFKFNR